MIATTTHAGIYNCAVTADAEAYEVDRWSGADTLGAIGTALTLKMQSYNGTTAYYGNYTYLKFDLSGVPDLDTVTKATLHVYVTTADTKPTIAQCGENWTEAMTWYTQPAAGAVLAGPTAWSPWATGSWAWADLNLATGGWNYSADLADNVLALTLTVSNWSSDISSREGVHPAYLVIETIPEPATMALLGIGAVALIRRRR